jgi:hypothetical protein
MQHINVKMHVCYSELRLNELIELIEDNKMKKSAVSALFKRARIVKTCQHPEQSHDYNWKQKLKNLRNLSLKLEFCIDIVDILLTS